MTAHAVTPAARLIQAVDVNWLRHVVAAAVQTQLVAVKSLPATHVEAAAELLQPVVVKLRLATLAVQHLAAVAKWPAVTADVAKHVAAH